MTEGRGKVSRHTFLVIDEEALEDRLVHETPLAVITGQVGAVEVPDEIQCSLEVALNGVGLHRSCCKPFFDALKLCGDATLLGLQEVERDRAGVVRLEELRTFVQQLPLANDEPLAQGNVVLSERGDLLQDGLLSLKPQLSVQLDRGVVLLDGLLDALDADGSLGAAARVALSSYAGEVRVDLAGTAPGVGND